MFIRLQKPDGNALLIPAEKITRVEQVSSETLNVHLVDHINVFEVDAHELDALVKHLTA